MTINLSTAIIISALVFFLGVIINVSGLGYWAGRINTRVDGHDKTLEARSEEIKKVAADLHEAKEDLFPRVNKIEGRVGTLETICAERHGHKIGT